jgi:hypothetical protein
MLGAAGAMAPAVKAAVKLPDVDSEKFPLPVAPASNPFEERVKLGPTRRYPFDVRNAVLFDRIRFDAGRRLPSVVSFFSNPLGDICPYSQVRKMPRHTNMYQGGQLPAPHEFLARRLLFAVAPGSHQADIDSVSAACSWQFQLMYKLLAHGPMLLNGPVAGEVVTTGGVALDPLPADVRAAGYDCSVGGGIYLPTMAHFAFLLSVDIPDLILLPAAEGGRGLDLLIGLEGFRTLPVQ